MAAAGEAEELRKAGAVREARASGVEQELSLSLSLSLSLKPEA